MRQQNYKLSFKNKKKIVTFLAYYILWQEITYFVQWCECPTSNSSVETHS